MKKRIQVIIGMTLGLLVLIQGMVMNNMTMAEEKSSNALIVVDPGFSGFSFQIAQKIAEQLQVKNIGVKIVKVNQFKNSDLENRDYVLIGGPTYAAQPSPKIKSFLTTLNPKSGLKAILFLTAGRDYTGLEPFVKLVQEKGLPILNSTVILTTIKDPAEINSKIGKLLEVI